MGISKRATKQTTTEKILWGIFNLLEGADNLLASIPGTSLGAFNTTQVEYRKILGAIEWRKSRHRLAQFINDLKRQGYIRTKIDKDKKAVLLTPKGFEKILKINIKRIDKKKRRDGKWQMTIWDIPENYKKTRNRFRTALKLLGYQQLQKSVWICPYSVLRETEKLIRFYRLEPYIKLFLISEVEMD